jgi:hypothetical protein
MSYLRRVFVTSHLGGSGLIPEQFMVDKVALGQGYLTGNFGIPKSVTILSIVHVDSSLFLRKDITQQRPKFQEKSEIIRRLTKKKLYFSLYLELWSLR